MILVIENSILTKSVGQKSSDFNNKFSLFASEGTRNPKTFFTHNRDSAFVDHLRQLRSNVCFDSRAILHLGPSRAPRAASCIRSTGSNSHLPPPGPSSLIPSRVLL